MAIYKKLLKNSSWRKIDLNKCFTIKMIETGPWFHFSANILRPAILPQHWMKDNLCLKNLLKITMAQPGVLAVPKQWSESFEPSIGIKFMMTQKWLILPRSEEITDFSFGGKHEFILIILIAKLAWKGDSDFVYNARRTSN